MCFWRLEVHDDEGVEVKGGGEGGIKTGNAFAFYIFNGPPVIESPKSSFLHISLCSSLSVAVSLTVIVSTCGYEKFLLSCCSR